MTISIDLIALITGIVIIIFMFAKVMVDVQHIRKDITAMNLKQDEHGKDIVANAKDIARLQELVKK